MMGKLATVIYLMAYVVSSQFVTANKRPLRSVLAPAEIITSYETISPIIINQSAETIHGNPHNLWVKFDMPGKTFELHLTINKKLLSPQYTETFIEDGAVMFDKGHKNCFYHGTVIGYAGWMVAMSTCAGLRGTFGSYEDIDTLYHIEPLGRSNEIEQTHIVFNSSVLSVERRNGTCGCNDSHIHEIEPPHNHTLLFDRVRRQSSTQTRIVEWFIFNDRRRFMAHNQSLTQTALNTIEIANIVDMLYAKIGIRVSLIGIQTWKQDLITVVEDADTLLKNLRVHLLSTKLPSYDSVMLITGIDLAGNTVGLAAVGTMCSKTSAGLTKDTGSSVTHVAATAAHELGHVFNIGHDNRQSCACDGINNVCIMTELLPPIPPMEWSNCSVSGMNARFSKNLDRCLFNEPTKKCGNMVREGDEICDCGTPEICDDPCCNPNTCQMADGAVCFNHEPCCTNCQLKSFETVCRSATSDCDITEYCTGNSSECPADRFRQDGADCANRQAYCSDGICGQVLDAICSANFDPFNGIIPSVGPQACFNHNTAGIKSGNCGHDSNTFLSCATADVRCGLLHCQNSGRIRFPSVTPITRLYFVPGQGFVRCKTFGTQPGDDVMLGLVPEGAKCGTNMLCRNRQCVALQLAACPSANSVECSGNGICNDLSQCSCNPGFIGTDCNTTAPKMDGSWSQWSSWGTCSVTCGEGSRSRTRTCTNPVPQGGGANCVGVNNDTESCNTVACPVDGGWGSWTNWSLCSATCGDGHRSRQRLCNNPVPAGSGKNCSGSSTERETCNITECLVNGGWGSWTNWSSCSATCGDGHRSRQRSCDNPSPSGGGNDCNGNNTQREICNIATCPVNGGWGLWKSWSSCSTTCGDGHRSRERFCDNPSPSGGGNDCNGNNTQTETCNIATCPVNGGWGSWTNWSSCSNTCGDGHRSRQRSCDNPPPSGGGNDCNGNSTQRETCNIAECPVNGGWGSWTSWSSCSVTCGDGHRTRQRSCDNPSPSGGGNDCSGSNNEQEICSALVECLAEEDCSVTEVSGEVSQKRNKTKFKFSSDGDPRAMYKCKLDDDRRFRNCKSPMVWKNLEKGNHTITVRAFCTDDEGEKYSTVESDFEFQIN